MKQITKVRFYQAPKIEKISLDREISLILVSGDPEEPFSMNNEKPFFADTFKTDFT